MLRFIVASVLVVASAGCKKSESATAPTRGSVGQPCAQQGKLTCLGPSEAIVCVDGKYEIMPCRDTKCSGGSMGDLCSNATFLPGEYCDVHMAPDDFWKHGCSVDRKSQLKCVGTHWRFEKPCPGKYGCRRVETSFGNRGGHKSILQCDDSVTEAGAACATENQYACASDFKRTLRCTSGTWQQDQVCRGPDGCKEAGDRVRCDDTLASVGDVCAQDGDQACSVDHGARLVCKAGKMVIDRKCGAGCLVVAGKVRAGREGPSFECR